MGNTASQALSVMPVERKDGTYALRLCLHQGLLDRDMLQRVQEVMDAFQLNDLRATTGQRLNLEGVPADRLDAVIEMLGTRVAKCPPSISVCSGGAQCKLGQQETRAMANRLLVVLQCHAPYPFKVKSGISGCAEGCGLSFIRDLGLVGGAQGWMVLYGGSARHRAAPGLALAKGLGADEALELVARGLEFYKEHGGKKERLGIMVSRLGSDAVLAALA
ncbi:nitrite reductase [Pseudodesulfovibrio karagichevae]|uniref:Nitrite reductase n=1 Tax=Pseudodesulfovibrio karagichevae TaxID=3239305 RepID=A0ABV4JXG0_9BACT